MTEIMQAAMMFGDWDRQWWTSKHTSLQAYTRWKRPAIGIGVNFESQLVWTNLIFVSFCFMWNLNPGRPTK